MEVEVGEGRRDGGRDIWWEMGLGVGDRRKAVGESTPCPPPHMS